jgi:hypothetical protein
MHEGDSVVAFHSIYDRARACARDPHKPSPAILIEDFDLSGAVRFGDTEYTVNQQLLVNYLMNLCDGIVEGGSEFARMPIYFTGNNFSALHEPLRRHGRFDAFTWSPEPEEVEEIVAEMLTGIANQPREAARKALASLPTTSIATMRFLIDHAESNYFYDQFAHVPNLGMGDWEHSEHSPYANVPTDHLVGDLISAYSSLNDAENFLNEEKEVTTSED